MDDAWGNVTYAALTGGAKTGTAVLGGQADITVTAGLRPLVGPPQEIAAFGTGNGFQDESILSAVWHGGRLWLSANDQCQVDPNPDYHACARFVALDTTVSPPAVAEQADFLDLDRDTFMPLVGVSRDGTAYFNMSASSAIAQQPIDHYATYRDLGDPIVGGADEVLFRHGDGTFPSQLVDWGVVGSIITDPLDSHAVMALYPTLYMPQGFSGQMAGYATRIEGGLDAPAGGTFAIDTGTSTVDGWAPRPNIGLRLTADPASPILWVRYSASPEVEASPNGDRLRFAIERPSSLSEGADLSSLALGGVPGASTVTAYVQWRSADGEYSEPVSQSLQIDTVMPTVNSLNRRFSLGSVVKTAPIRIDWTASDAPSGIARVWTVHRLAGNHVASDRRRPRPGG